MKYTKTKIAIVGAGFIGSSFAHVLSQKGVKVTLVDNCPEKRMAFQEKTPYFDETDFDWEFFFEAVDFQDDISKLTEQDVVFVCVGAEPSGNEYNTDSICRILSMLSTMFPKSEIVVRSTIDPSSLKKLKSDVQENTTMWFYPEYLREGNALSDILKNPNHICRLAGSGTLLEKLLNEISFKFELKDAYAASFNKIISNVWRANKISFMNACLFEAANLNINLKDFNELFLNDPKNTSGSYLGLGGPFGGYCLPKETQHLVNSASQSSLPIWKSTLEINENVINKIIDYFVNLDDDFDYCFIDLAFKEGTDDERNSPYFKIAQKLNSINPNKYRFCQDGTQMKISGSGATNSSAKYVMAKWYEFCI